MPTDAMQALLDSSYAKRAQMPGQVPMNPINNQQDPLGLGVIGRGMRSYQQGIANQARDVNNPIAMASAAGGPLPDPNMEGFLQALKENNASVKEAPGLPAAPSETSSTMWMPGQQSAVSGLAYGQEPMKALAQRNPYAK